MDLRNIDGGEAIFKIAKEITGEASFKRNGHDAPGSIATRTNEMVGTIVSAIDTRADAVFAAKFEAAIRHWLPIVGGALTVRGDVAPVSERPRHRVLPNINGTFCGLESDHPCDWTNGTNYPGTVAALSWTTINENVTCPACKALMPSGIHPVVREIRGEVGDRFDRVVDGDVLRTYEVYNVLPSETRELKCISSFCGTLDTAVYHSSLTSLRDPSLFHFISSVAERAAAKVAIVAADPGARGIAFVNELRPQSEMAVVAPDDDEVHAVKVGDRFKRMSGFFVGEVYIVDRFDEDGDAWGNLCDTRRCIAADELLDASRWTRVVAPEEVVSDDGSDLDAPVGNLRTAAEMLIETDTAIAKTIRAWHVFRDQYSPIAAEDFETTLAALADHAGQPVPWMRPE